MSSWVPGSRHGWLAALGKPGGPIRSIHPSRGPGPPSKPSMAMRVTPERRTRTGHAAKEQDGILSSFPRVAAMDRADQVLGASLGQCITAGPAQARVV